MVMPSQNPPQDQPCIDVKNLSFNYGGNQVLQDLTFQIKSGEYLGIIGPNGGGKTTLLKIILGLLKPATGAVKILGKSLKNFKDRSDIGYVPQRASQVEFQFPATVEEIVASGRTAKIGLFKQLKKADQEAINRAMHTAGVFNFRKRLIGELSGGERQKVFIARALATEPKILILDEPTAAIDIASQNNFYKFLADLNKRLKLTVIIVSHDIDVVAKEVATVLCLNRGLVCHGTPADLTHDKNLEKLYGKQVKFILHGH